MLLFLSQIQSEHKSDSKLCTYPLLTLHVNRAVHHIDNIFCDSHPKTGSLDSADRRISFTLERFKNMVYKFLAHANTCIFNIELIIGISFGRSGFLGDPHTHDAPCPGIFNSVAEQIQEHLVQSQLITIDFLIQYIYRVKIQFKLLCIDICLQDIADFMQNIRKTAWFFIQMYFAALNTAHIKDIIDQAEQMIA